MFDQVFKRAFAIARHANAPYADERERYLSDCLERGEKPTTVRRKAFELLRVASECKRKRAYADLRLTREQIDRVTQSCKVRSGATDAVTTRRSRVQKASQRVL